MGDTEARLELSRQDSNIRNPLARIAIVAVVRFLRLGMRQWAWCFGLSGSQY